MVSTCLDELSRDNLFTLLCIRLHSGMVGNKVAYKLAKKKYKNIVQLWYQEIPSRYSYLKILNIL